MSVLLVMAVASGVMLGLNEMDSVGMFIVGRVDGVGHTLTRFMSKLKVAFGTAVPCGIRRFLRMAISGIMSVGGVGGSIGLGSLDSSGVMVK